MESAWAPSVGSSVIASSAAARRETNGCAIMETMVRGALLTTVECGAIGVGGEKATAWSVATANILQRNAR